jgi:DNA-binding MarR family transcriptional regulator
MRVLLHVSHGIERVSLRMEAALGVTAQQRLVVRVVGRHPGITPGRLAEHLHLDPGTISALVRRLEGKGLIRRAPDPRDGRRIALGLTESGRALDRPQPGTVEEIFDQLVEAEEPETVHQVQALLTKLAARLEGAATDVDQAKAVQRTKAT